MSNAMIVLIAVVWLVLMVCNAVVSLGYAPLDRGLPAATAIFMAGVLVWSVAAPKKDGDDG